MACKLVIRKSLLTIKTSIKSRLHFILLTIPTTLHIIMLFSILQKGELRLYKYSFIRQFKILFSQTARRIFTVFLTSKSCFLILFDL